MGNKLIIAEQEISINKGGMYCLNDLHKAAVANGRATESQRPSEFLRNDGVAMFIKAAELETGFPASKTVKGRGITGTWATELVAMKYAGWIDPSYEVQVYQAVQALKRGDIEAALTLAKAKPAAAALDELRRTKAIELQVKNIKSVLEMFPQLGETSRQAIAAKMMNQVAGEELIPLPKVEGKFYSATELADEFESTAAMIGRLATKHDLKVAGNGEWRLSKSEYSSKQVETWVYNDAGREAVKHVIELARS